MATSTLIQFLQPGEAGDTSNRSQVEIFLAGATVTAGDLVQLDNSKTGADRALYVVQAAAVATTGNPAVIGVALGAAGQTYAAGTKVPVVVAGYVARANVDGATVAGSPLVGPIGTAGRSAIEVPGTTTGSVWGIALEADTSNYAAVHVNKRF